MAVFDTLQLLSDTDTLSAGDQIEFSVEAECVPFLGPSDQAIIQAFQNTSLQIISEGQGLVSSVVIGASQWDIKAVVTEVVTVGALRGQIVGAIQSASPAACTNLDIVNNSISKLIAAGSGLNGVVPTSGELGIGLGLGAALLILVVVFAVYHDLT